MKQKNLVLMVVAVGCGLVAAFLTTQINAKPKVETVEVVVAAKNLPVGTMMAKGELANLVVKKRVPKDALPPKFATTEEELIDHRLIRATMKDEVINPDALSKGGVVTLPEGKDMVSLSVAPVDAAAGFVGPGSKVDVLARINLGNTTEVFPLLIDMLVVTVNTHVSYDTKNGSFPDISMVSLAVTQEEALLLELAKQRGVHMSLLLRHDGKKRDLSYDMNKIKKMLETNTSPTKFESTAPPEGKKNPDDPPVAPTPSARETVKVLVATEDIAPHTEITKDLLEKKLVVKEFPKEHAQGACTDLSAHFGGSKVFRFGLVKDQVVLESMVGPMPLKPAPQDRDIDNQPKPGPNDPVKPVTPASPPRRTHDVAVHTASGTLLYRYEEVKPGEWKLMAMLTPGEAAKSARQPARDPEKHPEEPDAKTPETRKID